MTLRRARRPHYLRVLPDAPSRSAAAQAPTVAPMPPGPPPEAPGKASAGGPLPPRRPKRPAAAVRKSLRTTLAAAQVMREQVDDADPRFPQRADKAARALVAYTGKLAALADELLHALHCERQRDLWRRGKPYDAR